MGRILSLSGSDILSGDDFSCLKMVTKNKSIRSYTTIWGLIVLFGCCKQRYTSADIEFSQVELSYFDPFTTGDTLFFENGLGSFIAFEIGAEEKARYDHCDHLIQGRHLNSKLRRVSFLPGSSQSSKREGGRFWNDQSILQITKYPNEKTTEYLVEIMDFFSSSIDSLGTLNQDSLNLNNGKVISNYYKIPHSYPERVTEPFHIEYAYWTKEDGLVAYQNKDGEVWTRREL